MTTLDLNSTLSGLDASKAKVKHHLQNTPYATTTLRPLSGGNANFIFHADLDAPLSDGTTEVLVKQGEDFVAANPKFAIPTVRCQIEEETLRELALLPPFESPRYRVCTPRLYYFDAGANIQVQTYHPSATSLKLYALAHYPSPTPSTLEPQCRDLGHSLGSWLRAFHGWSNGTGGAHAEVAAKMRRLAASNAQLKAIKHIINYAALLSMCARFPKILGQYESVFAEIKDETAAEIADESKLSVIHGDFWTGNILIADTPIDPETPCQTTLTVVDWEMTELGTLPVDIGQMAAELYQLVLFRGIDAGRWMIQGLADGYGPVDEAFTFRVLLHLGAHLVCIAPNAPGWGSNDDVERVIGVGRDILLAAWRKDRDFFRGHELEGLFSA